MKTNAHKRYEFVKERDGEEVAIKFMQEAFRAYNHHPKLAIYQPFVKAAQEICDLLNELEEET